MATKHSAIVFTMRYPNDVGYVWHTIALHRDLTAKELAGTADCFIAYPKVTGAPMYRPRWAREVEADFYDYSARNKTRLKQFIIRHRISIIVFMSGQPSIRDLAFLRRLGVRTLNTENDGYDHARRQPLPVGAAKFLMRGVLHLQLHDVHIANSEGQFQFFRRFAKIPGSRLKMIREGIDTDHFQPGDRASACAQLGLEPERCWIMAASQARPEKRVGKLLEVVRRVKEARPETPVGFIHVGGGQCLDEWKRQAAALPDAADYRFFGAQPDLLPFYQVASVFVHGSFVESFGLVLVEAMATGLPVVATRANGPADIIVDGETGRLVERDDWDAFTAALRSYVDDRVLRRRHGEAGRQRCMERFSIARQARELASLIRFYLPKTAPRAQPETPYRDAAPVQ